MSTFSNSLKNVRRRTGITQEQLAETLNVTRQTVSGWETGRCEPDIGTLMALAEALDVPAEELIYGRAPVQNAYPRFQRKYVWRVAGCGFVLVLYLIFAGIIVPMARMTYGFGWLLVWTFTIRQTAALAGGVGLMAALALFFPVHFEEKKARLCRLAGILTVLPVVLLAADTLLGLFIPGYKIPVTFFFLRYFISNDLGTLFLLSALPFGSGVLLFLGLNRE